MGRKISLTRRDLGRLLVISILLLSIGNIGVLWGEEYVSSGLASLIVALVPIWVVMIEAWVFRAGRMTAKGLIGLAIGIVGLLVLLWPRITSGTPSRAAGASGIGRFWPGHRSSGRWARCSLIASTSLWMYSRPPHGR